MSASPLPPNGQILAKAPLRHGPRDSRVTSDSRDDAYPASQPRASHFNTYRRFNVPPRGTRVVDAGKWGHQLCVPMTARRDLVLAALTGAVGLSRIGATRG